MILVRGEVYLDESHIVALRQEPSYVVKRYNAVARTLLPAPFHITRKEGANLIKRSLRQFYRILNRFRQEGIHGLRFKSRRPHTSPNRTPEYIENKVEKVREETGFGCRPIADLINESFKREGKTTRLYPSTVNNIMIRTGQIEHEKRIQKEWMRFEWGHPNRLIQADLTKFNGVPILTMEDDYGRYGWAVELKDQKDTTVTKGMKTLIRHKYDNLLTDNGSQFSKKNSVIRKYCEEHINEKHIWTSVHHPETMGKLSAFQKSIKRFLRHKLKGSRDKRLIGKWIRVFVNYYNNGKYHSAIDTYPSARYHGKVDEKWYERLVKALKLEGVLSISLATG